MPHRFLNAVSVYLAKIARNALSGTLLWVVFIPRADAQNAVLETGGGEISGSVFMSSDNRPASQVVVSLKARLLGVSRSVLTDYEGHFAVQGLPAGAYEVSAEEAGFQPAISKVQLEGISSSVVLHLRQIIAVHDPHNKATVSVRQLSIPSKARDEYQHGLQSLAKNDLQEALKRFTKASAAYPNFYEAEYHAGLTQLRMGHREEAMQFFQEAVDLSEGRYAPAEFGVGALLYEIGNTAEAERIVRRGLELDDSLAEGHALLGMVLMREQRADEAERSAREALLRKTTFAQAYLVLADVHASRKEYRSQLQDLDAFLTLQPEGPERARVVQVREFALPNIAKSDLLVANASN